MTPLTEHALDVKNIQQQMRDFFARGQKVKIYHGTTNSTRAQTFERGKFIDISRLNRVLEINTEENYALVEPNVPMDELVDATLKYNLVPLVVMEFPGITVGGGIQGGAGESSSHKYGGFHNTCLEYEIILGNGDLLTASPSQNKELFYGTACSYGSLGIITLAKLRLTPAKDFVHLTYRGTKSFDEAVALLQERARGTDDFVDGILFSKDRGVVMTGRFSDKKDLSISTFSKQGDEWFYIHADHRTQGREHYEELIPIRDYLFRYDRGGFWVGRYAFTFWKMPFTRLTRMIFNGFSGTRTLFRFLHATNISQWYLVQDLCMPENTTLRFLRFIDEHTQIYPLWLCPLQRDAEARFSPTFINTDLVINVGVWGEVPSEYGRFVEINRDIENQVLELGGRKVLYAHQYYPQEQFWSIYDRAWYGTLRKKYSAETTFPDVYEKTQVKEQYRPSILAGLFKGLRSRKLPIS